MSYIYKYTEFKTGILILEGNNLKFNSPLNFKDELDCNIDLISFNSSTFTTPEIQKERLTLLIENPVLIQNGLNIFRDKNDLNEMYSYIINQKRKTSRITCFSTNSNNNQLWVEYGEDHKGLCLEFNLNETKWFEKPQKDFGANFVTYRSDSIKLNYFEIEKSKVYEDWIYSKHDKFFFEEEFRIIYFNKKEEENNFIGETLISFNPYFLSKVIIGKQVDSNNIEKLKNLLNTPKYKHIKLLQK